MRLNQAQKRALLKWIAEGIESDEISRRAAKFKPKFEVSRRVLSHYRTTRDVNIQELQQTAELDALQTGLALKEERVKVLQNLAQRMITDLLPPELKDSLLWTTDAKTVANEKYTYQEFNKAEVDALRGLLDDIATEVGGRVKRTDFTSGGEKVTVMSPEQIVEKVNELLSKAAERKKHAD